MVTPHGINEKVDINKIVMQGENLALLQCSVQIDTFGKECIFENKYLYYYRNIVPVPPLSMIDGLICISNCGINSILVICSSGKNDKNIADRIRKGNGIIQNLMSILEELYFGRFFAENPY